MTWLFSHQAHMRPGSPVEYQKGAEMVSHRKVMIWSMFVSRGNRRNLSGNRKSRNHPLERPPPGRTPRTAVPSGAFRIGGTEVVAPCRRKTAAPQIARDKLGTETRRWARSPRQVEQGVHEPVPFPYAKMQFRPHGLARGADDADGITLTDPSPVGDKDSVKMSVQRGETVRVL